MLLSVLVLSSSGQERRPINKFDQKKYEELVNSVDYTKEKKAKDSNNSPSLLNFTIPAILAKILIYAFIPLIFILLFILLRRQHLKIGKREDRVSAAGDKTEIDLIDKPDLEQMLENAIAQSDYRLSVRIQYLILLQLLNINGSIKWKPNKTNSHYLEELRNSLLLYKPFQDITRFYENAWYGTSVVTQSAFKDESLKFEKFRDLITPIKNE
ncbi:MAG: hypothetical protein HKN22_08405 [Bacteroidia bacterium]|nr:hypothetical protein [Bacteroidia bacterium]